LSILYIVFGVAFFFAIPEFIPIYDELHNWQLVGLPIGTRVLISIPPVLWLCLALAGTTGILALNRKYNSPWINLGFFVGLIVTGAAVIIALFLPLIDINIIIVNS